MITVNIQGHGTFAIDSSKLNELIQWLTANQATTIESANKANPGETLLNESGH
tara:strand:- start:405 stop:563 length:159 start_codon:yes stop_codon:yes gene_type:complete